MAESFVQEVIAALCAALVKDRNYFICSQQHTNEQMFGDPVKELAEEGRQPNLSTSEESTQTVCVDSSEVLTLGGRPSSVTVTMDIHCLTMNVHGNGLKALFKALYRVVTDSFVRSKSIAEPASKVPPAPTPEVQPSITSYVNDHDEFQFNAKPDLSGGRPQPKST